MEDYLRENLENGEQLLWTGGAASEKIMDNTYRMPYLLRFLISYGLAVALMAYAVHQTGGIKFSVVLVLIVLGSMIPFTAISDGIKVRSLGYAATDRRLIRINGSMAYSADYDEIDTCRFGKDPSGNTSLLCGNKAVKSRPSKWRALALFTGTHERDPENHVTDYVFYAIDDPEGLKKVLNGKVKYSEN